MISHIELLIKEAVEKGGGFTITSQFYRSTDMLTEVVYFFRARAILKDKDGYTHHSFDFPKHFLYPEHR